MDFPTRERGGGLGQQAIKSVFEHLLDVIPAADLNRLHGSVGVAFLVSAPAPRPPRQDDQTDLDKIIMS